MGKTTLDREMFCSICNEVRKHSFIIEQKDSSFSFGSDGKLDETSKEKMKTESEIIDKIFNNPQTKWSCNSCKKNGKLTKNYSEGAFMILTPKFSKENLPQTDVDKIFMAVESLAKVISYLEDRIVPLEEIFLKPRRRGVQILDSN